MTEQYDRFETTVRESWTHDGFFEVVLVLGTTGVVIQIGMPEEEAREFARELFLRLDPYWQAQRARYLARRERDRVAREARDEEERPERERKLAELAARIAAGPKIVVSRCPECAHLGLPEEFEEKGYACNGCGSTGRGEDGRRCDSCHRFRAKESDLSCPACEAPIEEVEEAHAVSVDGHLHETDPD